MLYVTRLVTQVGIGMKGSNNKEKIYWRIGKVPRDKL